MHFQIRGKYFPACRLNDDWAYGNETQSKPYDFHAEETQLRWRIAAFNKRRYGLVMPTTSGSGGGDAQTSSGQTGQAQADVDASTRLCGRAYTDVDFKPMDNNVVSVLALPIHLTDRFSRQYERWLQREVFDAHIDWDLLMDNERDSHQQAIRSERD